MGDNTTIEWTDASWNCIRGCSRVSEGCRHCYAERTAMRFSGKDMPYEGLVRTANGHPQWTGKVQFVEEHLSDPLKWKKPRRIFVNSMSDLFHDNVEWDWFYRILLVMMNANWHTFQVLTKRPGRMAQFVNSRDVERIIHGRKTDHIHWGTSVENQETADERIPELLKVKWGLRWISAEPLLGPVDLSAFLWCKHRNYEDIVCPVCGDVRIHGNPLGWCVAGAESGPKARPMDELWVRKLRDQLTSAEVPFFYKQNAKNGHKIPTPELDGVKWMQYPA